MIVGSLCFGDTKEVIENQTIIGYFVKYRFIPKLGLFSLLLIVVLCFFQYVEYSNIPISMSFYYWKSNVEIGVDWLKEYKPKHMYIKMLDISFRDRINIVPSHISSDISVPIIPVVFLDHTVLHHHDPQYIIDIILESIPPMKYSAIQIDCDWTPTTRNAFFEVIHQLQTSYQEISATIRLHQVKYFEITGVPPVDRGILMYYNMSDVLDPETKNYILDLEVASKYHVNFESYPLHLDLALPIYRQGRVFRNGRLIMLLQINNIDYKNLRQKSMTEPNVWEVISSHYSGGRYLYEGDVIKIDEVLTEDLHKAARVLQTMMNPTEVIFYEQQYAYIYGRETLERVVQIFE